MREPVKPEPEVVSQIEDTFRETCRNQFIKYGTEKYNIAERMFFSGAIMAFNYSVPKWGVALMSGRNILGKFK